MKIYQIRLILAVFLLFNFTPVAQCCIDPSPTPTITVSISYSTFIQGTGTCTYTGDVEIRLSNLRLMNEAPGKVCACALSWSANAYDSVLYISFVDSGTNNPYLGFAGFNEELVSNTAWDNAQSGFSPWGGYVASVINAGLSSTSPVELVIRAKASANSLANADSLCPGTPFEDKVKQSNIATDEWLPATDSLGNTHQKVRLLSNIISYTNKNSAYFTALDSNILNNIPTFIILTNTEKKFIQGPNPFTSSIHIRSIGGQRINGYNLYNSVGKLVKYEKNLNSSVLIIQRAELPEGIYILELRGKNEIMARQKIIIQ